MPRLCELFACRLFNPDNIAVRYSIFLGSVIVFYFSIFNFNFILFLTSEETDLEVQYFIQVSSPGRCE